MRKLIAALLVFSWQALAQKASANEVEVPVQQAFIPAVGFDNNDEVEVTVTGTIPNACYKIGRTDISFDAHKKAFTIRQFSISRNILQCLDKKTDSAGDYLATPYAYSRTLMLGSLAAGEYVIHHKADEFIAHERKFKVDAASTVAIDELPYAPVTSVFIPEIVEESRQGEVILTGVFDSSCVDIGDVAVQRLDDVIVLLPKLKVNTGQNCVVEKRPLQKIVNIGELKEGQYLLHVRSQSGLAVNRTFSVIKKKADPRASAPVN